MCFSATASFTLSAALVPAGLMCLRQASKLGTNWTALAVCPLAFAIQQASEGVVWLGLSQSDPQLANMGALGFLFFSHFFWLVWVPLSVYMLHRGDDTRAQALLMMLMLGTAFAVTLSAPVWAMDGYIPLDISSGSVSYLLPLMLECQRRSKTLPGGGAKVDHLVIGLDGRKERWWPVNRAHQIAGG